MIPHKIRFETRLVRKQRLICYDRLRAVNLALSIPKMATGLPRVTALALLLSAASLAQTPTDSVRSAPPHPDPVELVRQAVQNELKANNDDDAHFLFRGVKTTPKGSTTKIYVETSEGTAGLVVAYDGKPLTHEQHQAEQARLERFVRNPEELRKKRAQEREEAERTIRIMRALPKAFLFEYAGEETGTPGIGEVGDPLVKLTFHPNPSYRPPSRVEEVLTGMQGKMLVDAVHHRIASIDGMLFKQVGFGWGILGHLDRGGQFVVHQQEVEDNGWEISSMTVNFTGKILMVRNLFIQSTEVFSGFKRVPSDLHFAQALELLEKEEAALAENRSAGALEQKP